MTDAFGSLDLFAAFKEPIRPESSNTYDNAIEVGIENEQLQDESEEVKRLRSENMKLKARLRLFERFGHLFPSQTPLAEVDYYKSPLSLECQARIESELYTLLCENRETSEEHGPEEEFGPHGQVLYLPYYMIDSMGKFWENTPVQYGDGIPQFTQLFNIALDDKKDKLDMFGAKLPKENMKSGPECFNCGGPHRLSDCKEPRDKKRIAEKLKEFKESRGSSNQNDRYHVRVEKEIDDRFKSLLPGTISENLRSALGLEDHELPPHIYRMRNFGYPPGYSIDPPLANSTGLVMYYKGPGVTKEDGELEDTPLATVIEYHGYTAPPQPQVIDKFAARNLPYNAITPTLSDKRKPDKMSKRRRIDHTLGEDDMEVDNEGGHDLEAGPAHDRRVVRPRIPAPATPQPPLPPPIPVDSPPQSPGPQPPPPTPPSDDKIEEGELSDTTEPQETSDVQPDNITTKNADLPMVCSTPKQSTSVAKEATEKIDEDISTPLNRSIVSETNKIGIKFDQVEDYGPLDERAGNFTKLQCILRSRKRSLSRTPKRAMGARVATRKTKK